MPVTRKGGEHRSIGGTTSIRTGAPYSGAAQADMKLRGALPGRFFRVAALEARCVPARFAACKRTRRSIASGDHRRRAD